MRHGRLPEIQRALDHRFSGTRVEFDETIGYWFITDWIYDLAGRPAKMLHFKVPSWMFGLFPSEFSNRRVAFIIQHPETGYPVEPTRDNTMWVLTTAWHGGRATEIQKMLDRCDEGEAVEKQMATAELHDASREAARVAWNNHKGKITSTSVATTNAGKAGIQDSKLASEYLRDRAAWDQFIKDGGQPPRVHAGAA